MTKKSVAIGLSTALLFAVQLNSYSRPAFLTSYTTGVDYKIENIVDVKPKHWAYNAVKYVTEDLNIMEPKTPTRFMGDKTAIRYELARTFYNATKGLEDISEKSLKLNQVALGNTLTDVNDENKNIVNTVVNEYAIMQLMPDNRFMGNREMTRYELAFDLNNYLLLLEKKIGVPEFVPRDKVSQLTDLSQNHWAYQAVQNIVDRYKIMDGYPQKVFGGDQKLTRYEVSALIKKFVECVDHNVINIPVPTPTPEPTPLPTPVPTPIPTPVPTPTPSLTNMFDFKAGVSGKSIFSSGFSQADPSVNIDLNMWLSRESDLMLSRFGVGLNGEYLFNDYQFESGKSTSRLTAGGSLNWKLAGFENDKDTSVVLGLGYNFTQWNGTKTTSSHGPKLDISLEVPLISWLNLYVKESFTLYTFSTTGLKNDAFVGFNLPVNDLLGFQLGYTDTRYTVDTLALQWQGGLQGNVRFRF